MGYNPKPVALAARIYTLSLLWGIGLILGSTIIGVMAYRGEINDWNLYITFPNTAIHIQRAFVAMPAAEFIIHIWLGRSYIINVRRFEIDCLMTHDFSHETARIVKGFCFRLNGPWHSIATAGWITCAYFQSTYVPMLGAGKLPECVETNNGLKQCKMVNASWILAIIYCVFHAMMLSVICSTVYLASVPAIPNDSSDQQVMGTANKRSTDVRPPSYETTASGRPPSYASAPPYHERESRYHMDRLDEDDDVERADSELAHN